MSTDLLFYCRPGFEPECAQEIADLATRQGAVGFARAERGEALVRWHFQNGEPFVPAWRDLIFARQVLAEFAELRDLDPRDRLAPIVAALRPEARWADAWVECADSESGAALKALCRSFEAVLVAALRRDGRLDAHSPKRLHVLLTSGTAAVLAESRVSRAAPWPMGIPRLRLPREAPSRSALKIEEAWLTLMGKEERERWLAPGRTAVDLGAAPGGWTWQLTRKSIRVTAVDNGPLREHVLATGLVEHLRADGFRFRPRKPVDWVVCDMVEQPARIAALMGEWLAGGHARAALFNLKLPMKKRWQETRLCLDGLRDTLAAAGPWTLRAKQLYHDREEITVLALPGAER